MLASCNKDEHQHSYTSSVTTPATCSNPGVETFTCSCGAAYTQIIPATNDHAWEKIKVYANSCESEGWTVYECSVCHEQKQDDWVQKRDHKYEAVETVEATCTTDGYQIMQCSYCGDRYTDDQYSSEHKATGHKWIVNESPADPADLTDAEGWKVVSPADCLNAAQLQRTCSVCGETEEKVGAAATGHKIKDSEGKLVDPAELCKVNDKLVDAEGNKIYAFECVNENCPVSVVVDARGTKKHYVEAVEHELKTVYEHINCEDNATTGKSYILQICENCDTYGTAYVDGTNSPNKKTEVEPAGHDYNTVQTDGKTSVVVCIEDKGLNTQAKYLEYMRSVVDFATFQANKTAYAAYWTDVATKNPGATGTDNGTQTLAISRVCARCGAVTVANGHNYVIAKYVDGSFTEYEKDEEGALVDYSKEVTVASMNCRYVRICSGCGDVTNRGTHKNVSAVSCRAPGVCADCGRDVDAQLSHIYSNISKFVGADGKAVANASNTFFAGTTISYQAAYDAWKKVSATETWMVPVNGDCDSASTDVTVCVKCLIDASNGTEVVWNQATEKPATGNIPTSEVSSTNAYVITSEFSHVYQPVYFDLDAKDTTAQSIPAYNTDCQIGFKTAYICSKCGDVFTNVPVANDPDTKPADQNVEENDDDTNEAKDNKLDKNAAVPYFTDANGFVINTPATDKAYEGSADGDAYYNSVDFDAKALEAALANVDNNNGQHILYLVEDYDGTAGYEAPTCATVAKVPYYCLNCGQIIVLDATASGADKDKPVNAPELTYNIANEIVADDTFDAQSKKNSYGYTVEQVAALKAAVQKAAGLESTDDLVSIDQPTKLDATNHAGKAYGCGTHCDYKVNNAFACTGYNSLLTDEGDKLTDQDVQAQIAAMKHDTVTVTYQMTSGENGVSKYYSNYTLKIANVGTTEKNPALVGTANNDINNYITSFEDTTKVSVCSGNKYVAPTTTGFVAGTSKGKFLVLVDANNKAYAFNNVESNQLKFYYESNMGKEIEDLSKVTVLDNDIFFVGFAVTAGSTLPVDAPVTASDATSLGFALQNDPTEVTENGTKYDVYTVNVSDSFEITSTPTMPAKGTNAQRVVFELGGNTLTMKINTVQSPSDKAFWDVSNELVFKNGELKVESSAAASFDVEDSAVLTMENVVFTTNNNAIRTEPSESGAGEINLTNTTIRTTGEYAVGTNAATGVKLTEESENKVIINITDSTITAGVEYNALTGAYTPVSDKDGTALFINVPSKVTVEGSTLVANHQTVMVRGGELEMSDSTVKLVKMDDTDDSLNMAWATGNDAPRAAMLLGNKNRTDSETAYQYKTTVILDNVKFDVDTADRTVVIASDYTDTTLKTIAKNDGLEEGEVPVMVYFDGGNCVNDKQIDFVDGYDEGTIQLIDCGDASGIY